MKKLLFSALALAFLFACGTALAGSAWPGRWEQAGPAVFYDLSIYEDGVAVCWFNKGNTAERMTWTENEDGSADLIRENGQLLHAEREGDVIRFPFGSDNEQLECRYAGPANAADRVELTAELLQGSWTWIKDYRLRFGPDGAVTVLMDGKEYHLTYVLDGEKVTVYSDQDTEWTSGHVFRDTLYLKAGYHMACAPVYELEGRWSAAPDAMQKAELIFLTDGNAVLRETGGKTALYKWLRSGRDVMLEPHGGQAQLIRLDRDRLTLALNGQEVSFTYSEALNSGSLRPDREHMGWRYDGDKGRMDLDFSSDGTMTVTGGGMKFTMNWVLAGSDLILFQPGKAELRCVYGNSHIYAYFYIKDKKMYYSSDCLEFEITIAVPSK